MDILLPIQNDVTPSRHSIVKTLSSILKDSRSVSHSGTKYYVVKDILKALSPKEKSYLMEHPAQVELPVKGETTPCVTAEQAEELIGEFVAKQQPQSNFNEKLAKALKLDSKED